MKLTLRQIKAFSTERDKLKDAGMLPARTTKAGKKWWGKLFDRVVKNLKNGRRWDVK